MSTALGTQLKACLNNAASDLPYYTCLVSSGMFASPSCNLACPQVKSPTKACCNALTVAANCTAKTATKSCKNLIDTTFAAITQCSMSSATIGVITLASIVAAVTIGLALFVCIVKRRGMSTLDPLKKWTYLVRNLTQLRVLVWKNLTLMKNHPMRTIIESLLPLVLVVALVILGNLDVIAGDKSSDESNTTGCTGSQCSAIMYAKCQTTLPKIFSIGEPTSTTTSFYSSGQPVFGMFFLLAYLRFIPSLTSRMVVEKELKITEGMRMMGLKDGPLLLSWYITGFLQYTPIALLLAIELKYGNVFPMADLATMFLFFTTFGLAIVSFANLVGVFFNKSKTAAIASVLIWVIAFLPFYAVENKSNSHKYAASLCAPTAFAHGINYLVVQAQRGKDVYYAVAEYTTPITDITIGSMTWYLLFDSIWMLFLGWYLQQVVPQEYGVQKPLLFLFDKEYWSPSLKIPINEEVADFHYADVQTPALRPDEPTIEAPSQALRVKEETGECIQICGLRKTFNTEDGEKVALHGLNVTMYSGQITAFLGHNGAGKTTTISMLTGLFPPTKGTAYVFGKTITQDMDQLRTSMGVCPQHDVLYDELTVLEHLKLYAALKSIPSPAEQINSMIAEVGLTEKRNVMSAKLSGGQKRKLSVAIALLGKSQVVFLDEPTSGMDPYSRRFTWNVLQRNRESRVMVLTTHFMDEADLLGDRIVILSEGRLCCAGSSLFLKQMYGTGYNLTLVKREACNIRYVVQYVQQYVPQVKVLSNVGSEVVLQLPTSSSEAFPQLLHGLDQNLAQLQLMEYGISVTTLEEVFLRIARTNNPADGDLELQEWRSSQHAFAEPKHVATRRTRTPTFESQYFALLQKRFRVSKRDKKTWFFMVLIPILFLALLAALPSINVASYLPIYKTADSFATEYYQQCFKLVNGSDAKCAFGKSPQTSTCSCQVGNGNKLVTYSCDTSSQNSCSSGSVTPNLTTSSYPYCAPSYGAIANKTACMQKWFSHCSLGLGDCNATSCCDSTNTMSPYYPCSSCATNTWPCYKGNCMKKDDAKLQGLINTFLAALIIVIGFSFVPASVVVFVVKEKDPHQNAKYQQMACGTSVFAYWSSLWTHDILFMLIPVAVAVGLLPLYASFKNDTDSMLGAFALLLAHVLSMLPLSYLFTFRFTKHSAAQTSILVFCLVTGGLFSIISFLCRLIDFDLIKNELTLAQLDTMYLR
ncbi:ATP-binding Cassette (ABC) Superfamily, partial [Thraustotheca clavata]